MGSGRGGLLICRVEITWRHYKDGGWLAKAVRKGKTVAWLTVQPGALLVSFHFAERLRAKLLDDETVGENLRQRVSQTPVPGKLFTIPLAIRADADITDARQLLEFKLSTK